MDQAIYWMPKDNDQELTPGVRAYLLNKYGYAAPAHHTYAAEISIEMEGPTGKTCVETMPYTFVLDSAQTGTLEADIDAAVRARLLALRNLMPLTAIRGRRHYL